MSEVISNAGVSVIPITVMAGAVAGAPAPAPPLPCLKGTISNEVEKDSPAGLKGRTLRGMLRDASASAYWWKAVFVLVARVKELAEVYGIERLGFLTLTFSENVDSKQEAEKRFNAFRTGVIDKRYEAWLKVFDEGDKRGRRHFHLLVVMPADIRTGFDFHTYYSARSANKPSTRRYWTNIYRATASVVLRAEWKFLRGTASEPGACARYGFGRHELTPISSTAEAVGRYLGKYLAKGLLNRPGERGLRRLAYCRRAWASSAHFSSVNSPWRKKLVKIAETFGFVWSEEEGFADFRYLWGPRWALKLRDAITLIVLPHEEYPTEAMAINDYKKQFFGDLSNFGISDVIDLCRAGFPSETMAKALRQLAGKVWNGTLGCWCSTVEEVQEIAQTRCYPGLPF